MTFVPDYIEGAEHGVHWPPFIGDGNGIFDASSGEGTALDSVSTSPASGVYCYRINPTATNILVRKVLVVTPSGIGQGCFKVKLGTSPDVECGCFSVFNPTDSCAVTFAVGTDGTIRAKFWNGGAYVGSSTGPTLSTTIWTLVEFSFDVTGTTWVIQWRANGATQTNASAASQTAKSDLDRIQLGAWGSGSITTDYFLDDLAAEIGSNGDHPVGDHVVLGFPITGNGTHNLDAATSAFYFKDIGGVETFLTTSETTSYQVVDKVPIDGDVDHIGVRGAIADTSKYVEYLFEDYGRAPVAVRIIVNLNNDSALANAIIAKIHDGTNEQNIYSGTVTTTEGNLYRDLHLIQRPNSGGSWTVDAFNNLRLRWGFTNDADGTPRLKAGHIQAVFPASIGIITNPLVGISGIGW